METDDLVALSWALALSSSSCAMLREHSNTRFSFRRGDVKDSMSCEAQRSEELHIHRTNEKSSLKKSPTATGWKMQRGAATRAADCAPDRCHQESMTEIAGTESLSIRRQQAGHKLSCNCVGTASASAFSSTTMQFLY